MFRDGHRASLRLAATFAAALILLITGARLGQARALRQTTQSDLAPPPYRIYLPIILKRYVAPLDTDLSITNQTQSQGSIPLYQKFEATFNVTGTVATNLDFPYDPAPPPGLPGRIGLSVEALLLPPGVADWNQALVQPAFQYQAYQRITRGEGEGLYPNSPPVWKMRFAPTQTGVWTYKLRAQDASICPSGLTPCPYWIETAPQTFTATAALAGAHGFVRVSPSDSRYFEFTDGTPFLGLGHQTSFGAGTRVESSFDTYEANGVNLLRTWMSATGVYGLGFWFWDNWANSSLVFSPAYPGHDVSARIVGSGTSPCIFQGFGEGAQGAFRANRSYRIEIRARLENVDGPRVAGRPYGLVAKFGAWPKDICGNPNNGLTTLSSYWHGTRDWTVYFSTFTMPSDTIVGWDGYFTLALENTDGGTAYIDEVRVVDVTTGANALPRGDMNYHLYFDQASSWRWDTILDRAAERNVFLKLVLLEKQDGIFGYINPDGSIAGEPSDDNFYGVNTGNWSQPTKVRRLQEYFWRYLSARWGYSTAVHSWELLNEGDPFSIYHYDQVNDLGRIIRATDPNRHLVTTSFWHSFPVNEFWANPNYPYVDYADFHAYIDTSWLDAPDDILDPVVKQQCGSSRSCYRNAMKDDSALYHSEHSLNAGLRDPGKPVVRGEAGLTLDGTTQEPDPQLIDDTNGVWLHKLLFSQVDAGGLTDIYWFTEEIARNDLYPVFKRFRDFMAGIPFNSGLFVDANPLVSGTNLRAFGQKDTASSRAYLWIDNRTHTWKRVVNGQAATPASSTVSLSGFTPNVTLPIQWWNTCSGRPPNSCTASISSQGTVTADASGRVTIEISRLETDLGVRVGAFPASP